MRLEEHDGRAGHLELRQDEDRFVHYLAGKAVRSGDELDLLLAGGKWLRGRYEWNGAVVVWPAFRIGLEGFASPTSGRKLSGALPLPPAALLRWPEPAEAR